jgi:hypothetical protein
MCAFRIELMYRTVTAAKLLAFAELALEPKSYASLGDQANGPLEVVMGVITGGRWVEDLTITIEKLNASSVSLFEVMIKTDRTAAKKETPTPPAHHSALDRTI